jgi:hypothetical protein
MIRKQYIWFNGFTGGCLSDLNKDDSFTKLDKKQRISVYDISHIYGSLKFLGSD